MWRGVGLYLDKRRLSLRVTTADSARPRPCRVEPQEGLFVCMLTKGVDSPADTLGLISRGGDRNRGIARIGKKAVVGVSTNDL